MTSKFPYLPLCVDAYRNDTAHLSLEEHGAYLKLLMLAWRSPGCMLPNDDVRLARMLGISTKKWSVLKPSVMDFWTLADGSWVQGRLSKEHDYVSQRAEKRRAAGALGGAAKSLKNNDHTLANAAPIAEADATPFAQALNTLHQTQEKKDNPSDPKGSSAPKGADMRGHRLPIEFISSPEAYEICAQWGYRGPNAEHVLAEFYDHWSNEPKAKGVKLDWRKTLRNRMRQLGECRPGRVIKGAFPPRPSPVDDRADVLQALKTGGQHVSPLNDQSLFDLGPVIEHQGDGRHDRDVPRALGGGSGRLSQEGYRFVAGAERR